MRHGIRETVFLGLCRSEIKEGTLFTSFNQIICFSLFTSFNQIVCFSLFLSCPPAILPLTRTNPLTFCLWQNNKFCYHVFFICPLLSMQTSMQLNIHLHVSFTNSNQHLLPCFSLPNLFLYFSQTMSKKTFGFISHSLIITPLSAGSGTRDSPSPYHSTPIVLLFLDSFFSNMILSLFNIDCVHDSATGLENNSL